MENDSRLYAIWLAETFGQGSRTAALLLNRFRSARRIYEGVADSLEADDEFDEKRIAKIQDKLSNRTLERAKYILSKSDDLGINVITWDSAEYPKQLRTLPDMPVVLYVRGNLPDCSSNMLTTIVGTRTMTDYGRKIAYSLGRGLAYGGSVIVSGMALGADSMGMLGALDSGGKTIAVLGSGVDVIYPKEHKEIYYKITEKGAVISEYAPGTPPVGAHFPVRNRIMSGLSDATVVVEGNLQSGSLITARLAITQGKKLFAVPGKVGEDGAEGPNLLIRDGAIPCVCAEDILSEFEFIYKDTISVNRAHSLMRDFDSDNLSADAMAKMRIGTSYESRNYYGKGTYGGRADRKKKNSSSDKKEIVTEIIPGKNEVSGLQSKLRRVELKKEEKTKNNYIKTENNSASNKEKNVKNNKNVVEAQKIDLEMLDENEIKVYNKMKPNVPTLPDDLVGDGINISTVMSALTMLEMTGAVESGGGGYFMRVVPEDIMQSEND